MMCVTFVSTRVEQLNNDETANNIIEIFIIHFSKTPTFLSHRLFYDKVDMCLCWFVKVLFQDPEAVLCHNPMYTM